VALRKFWNAAVAEREGKQQGGQALENGIHGRLGRKNAWAMHSAKSGKPGARGGIADFLPIG
jgi:hypothetical protein